MADLIAAAPEELRHVLEKVKMSQSKADNMKSLGDPTINKELLAKTLGHLKNINMDDESITMLLKDGRKDMIIREVINLMPMPCVTCNSDSEFQPGDKPQVRCRRCRRGACKDCFPEPKNGWVYLCSICDEKVLKVQKVPEALLSAKHKKTTTPSTEQSMLTQNTFSVLSGLDDEERKKKSTKNKRKREMIKEEMRKGVEEKRILPRKLKYVNHSDMVGSALMG